MLLVLIIVSNLAAIVQGRASEVWTRHQEDEAGIIRNDYNVGAQPFQTQKLISDNYPLSYNWCDMNNTNYCTISRNQHIPQYCGSCWAHASLSALGDRIKISRKAREVDINLSVQHILNCGIGSCHGGSAVAVYYWIKSQGYNGISYETSNPYLACSSDSEEGFCPGVDWSCNALNVARTCPTFGKKCVGLTSYPNVTIAEYGVISGVDAMMKEIYVRGPIACDIDSDPIDNYTGGVFAGDGMNVNHVISVVGWGTDRAAGKYWIVRNSWGEYWGEMGFIRVAFGSIFIESNCAWATIGSFTAPEFGNQVHCYEDGSNCKTGKASEMSKRYIVA